MKKTAKYLAAVCIVALAGAFVAGCSGPAASSSPEAPEQLTTEELIAELEDISSSNDYQSVTMDMKGEITIDYAAMLGGMLGDSEEADDAEASDESIEVEAIEEAAEDAAEDADDSSDSDDSVDTTMSIPLDINAKCDLSDGTTKMYMTMNLFGQDLEMYVNGEDAVMVMGGEAIGATLEELGMSEYASIDSIMESQGGDFSQFKDAVESIEKTIEGDETVYRVVCDPALFMKDNESVDALSEYGAELSTIEVVYRVNADKLVSAVDIDMEGTGFSSSIKSSLYDYNATTVPEAPEPTANYSDLDNLLDEDIDLDIDDEDIEIEEAA